MNTIEGRRNRRDKTENRLIWLTDANPLFHPRKERRACVATRQALVELLRLSSDRQLNGLIIGTLRCDGRIDLIATGDAYSYPGVAGGVASRLVSVTNHLFEHPLDVLSWDDS